MDTKKIDFQTDPWSRYQQTGPPPPNQRVRGGPGRGKHKKKATGYMNQMINMQRWMIKKLEVVWYINLHKSSML
jgi:hypothetical protein